MSLEHASITWSAKQLSSMVKNGKIDFNHIVQRSYVWERSRKSALIESMIIGYDIPKVYAKRTGNGKRGGNVYGILDGKQRLSTVKQFFNDEFALTELPPVTYLDEELGEMQTTNISGRKFSELPTGLQDLLQTITFNVVYYDNLTKEEERELFKRLNAGKPLSTKSKVLASCPNIEELLDIGSHDIFSEMLTEKAIDNKNQVTLVMKSWCMLNMQISMVSFETKQFNPLLEQQTHISDEESYILATVFDYAMDVHKILSDNKQKKLASKMYKETHFISLIPYFKKASDIGIEEFLFADWLKEFYGTLDKTSISDSYNEASNNGVSKTFNIMIRNEALKESFYDFFKDEEPITDTAQEEPADEAETSDNEGNPESEEPDTKDTDTESENEEAAIPDNGDSDSTLPCIGDSEPEEVSE